MAKAVMDLTKAHKAFAEVLVLGGLSPGAAAVQAGFTRQHGYNLIDKPEVQRAIERAKVLHKIGIEQEVAHCMLGIMRDGKASTAGRVAAGRLLADYTQMLKPTADEVASDDWQAHTLAELQSFIGHLETKRAARIIPNNLADLL